MSLRKIKKWLKNKLGLKTKELKEYKIFTERNYYKPFDYPWAYQYWEQQQNVHWLPKEITTYGDDIYDWNHKLKPEERQVVLHILRFFTQADIEVQNCYMRKYATFFKPTEISMMLAAFSNMETIHVAAYSHLIDTLQIPEIEYSAFMNYKTMRDKHNYLDSFDPTDVTSLLETMAVFGGFTEGMVLYSSFAILLNFQRFGMLKSTAQIVAWSNRDEAMHCEAVIKLFHTLKEEAFNDIDHIKLKNSILKRCQELVDLEDIFIDEAFGFGEVPGMTADELKLYMRLLADRRLIQLGYEPFYHVTINPMPWLDEMLNGVEFVNFFEGRVVDYAKAASTGDWTDVWKIHDTNLVEKPLLETDQ